MTQKRRRFSFGIRLLLLVVSLIAVGLAWVRHETRGRLVLESDTGEIIFSIGAGPFVQIPVDGSRTELESSIRTALDQHARKQGLPESAVYFTEVQSQNRRFLKYYYDKWVRQRLDLARCRYVLDYNDPVARSRNKELAETIERAARTARHGFRR
jgi:hypothetical protein